MTDTEKDTLCARIDELCAELNRTQLNRDMWLTRAKVTLKNLTSARAENAKLRELVRGMWREGAFEAGANYVTEAYALEERTRELGIEVR